jgi:lipopolysaccharide heptosyltransferase III
MVSSCAAAGKDSTKRSLSFADLQTLCKRQRQMEQTPKILAIQFKYFGDAVLMTPALRAIREHFPKGALHVLVPEEVAPIFNHLPWLHRVWPMPRERGSASLGKTWPIICALRRERFDRSVDFAGNDRGAILSFLCGARERLGFDVPGGFLGRRFCYNQYVLPVSVKQHESLRLAHILSRWNIAPPISLETEIRTDPAKDALAIPLLPERTILCHIASSQPKKEWPVQHWAAFYQLAVAAGRRLAFTTATSARERSLLTELKKIVPTASVLPVVPDLALFLALLKRSEVFISGDTGPLHFAAGLGVPTIALFGPSSAVQWAPVGERHRALTGGICVCDGNSSLCQSSNSCLAAISPEQVFDCLQIIIQCGPLSKSGANYLRPNRSSSFP